MCLLWSVLFKTQLDDIHCEIKLQAVLKTSDVVFVLLSSLWGQLQISVWSEPGDAAAGPDYQPAVPGVLLSAQCASNKACVLLKAAAGK